MAAWFARQQTKITPEKGQNHGHKMHIAIDDTYGPDIDTGSKFVTANRRTHVAVVFEDNDTANIRVQLRGCLEELRTLAAVDACEFHFSDIYNRRDQWKGLPDKLNLVIFEFFAEIYRKHRWPVHIQTIDDRTLKDHGVQELGGAIDGLDLSNREDISLLFLLLKIKLQFKPTPSPILLFVDEGKGKLGTSVGGQVFHDWPQPFCGRYCSSSVEPLLQIADFLAFAINRSTYLATKKSRTDIDNWFIELVGSMSINTSDMVLATLPENFTIDDFDELHIADRERKGL